MITNKDISIDSENGKIVLNGDKYDLGTQGEIDTAVKDVYSVMGQMGAKNLFNSQYSAPRTNAGTTATLGDDGHVILNGTANADAAQLLRPGTTIKPINGLKVGDKLILSYKVISGTFTHGSSSAATTLYFNNKNGSAVDPINFPSSLSAGDSDSKEITLTDVCFTDGILDLKDIQIYMRNGDTFNNLELAIMLRLASDTDNTYEPYAMTNKQLTEQVAEVKGTIGDLTQTGITGASVAAQLETIGDQLDIEHITNLSIDTSKITIGTYDCYVKAGVCYLSLYSCSFLASGPVSASISNVPKSLVQALSPGYGSSVNAADLISEYGWIAGNSTTISFTVSEANKSKNRDYYLVYPVATS